MARRPGPKRTRPIDLKKVKTYSIKKRTSKFQLGQLAGLPEPGKPLARFFQALPPVLRAQDLLDIAYLIVNAHRKGKGVVWMMGAHPIKCGLSPIIIDLMKRKIITAVAMNGAAAIHDFELAFFGHTSEDVEAGLEDGSFGMAAETGQWFNELINIGVRQGYGIAEALGRGINQRKARFRRYSILAQALNYGAPAMVHAALGTDITHQHPEANGALLGQGTMHDFRLFVSVIPSLNQGGVVINCGSAVIMPEVFLKVLNLARNLGRKVRNFAAVNLDMISHYRPQVNVLDRPTKSSGKSFNLVGHHEIMLPLLYAAIRTYLKK